MPFNGEDARLPQAQPPRLSSRERNAIAGAERLALPRGADGRSCSVVLNSFWIGAAIATRVDPRMPRHCYSNLDFASNDHLLDVKGNDRRIRRLPVCRGRHALAHPLRQIGGRPRAKRHIPYRILMCVFPIAKGVTHDEMPRRAVFKQQQAIGTRMCGFLFASACSAPHFI